MSLPDLAREGAGLSPLRVDELLHGQLLPTLREVHSKCDAQLRRQLTDATDELLRHADALAAAATVASVTLDPYPLKIQAECVRRLVSEALRTNVEFLEKADRVVDNLQLAMINVSTHRLNTQQTPVQVHVGYFPTILALDTAIHSPSLPTPTRLPALAQMPQDMFMT